MADLRNLEQTLTRIWADVLNCTPEQIGRDDPFFALGGDSVLILQVMDRVASTLFADRPDETPGVAAFFAHGTIRSFASFLTSTAAR